MICIKKKKQKKNTKNLFSCSANRNLKNAPELILNAPSIYSNNNLHLKVPQRNKFSKSWFITIFILPRMPCNRLKSKWNPYFTFREQSKYRTVWNWKYVDYYRSTRARDVYQIYGTKDRRARLPASIHSPTSHAQAECALTLDYAAIIYILLISTILGLLKNVILFLHLLFKCIHFIVE